MSKRRERKLSEPGRGEVKIWFQGPTGSGKSMLAKLITHELEKRGVKVRNRDWLSGVPMENQIVDLTHQNIDDVLTVELGSWEELEKLQFWRREAAE
jgi:thymidylate kinase